MNKGFKKGVKYALVRRVTGTEKYVTSRLEYDIKDVYSFLIVEEEDIDSCDEILAEPTSDIEYLKRELETNRELESYYNYYYC